MGIIEGWKLLLHLLVLLIPLHVQSINSPENKLIVVDEDQLNDHANEIYGDHDHAKQHSHATNPMGHMESNVMVFFTLKDLKLGQTIPVYFPKKDLKKAPKFIPRNEAESIPFSSEKLEEILTYFSFSPESPQGTAIGETLTQCEARPIEGETKACLTSLESMLDFSREAFGPNEPITAVTTSFLTEGSKTTFQNYTVSRVPREIPAPRMVACHTMPYPYAIFYCHHQESESRVFKVRLEGENSDVAEALAVCHMDTSKWSPSHVSFRVLGFGPGTLPICHFFPAEHLVWVPSPTTSSAI